MRPAWLPGCLWLCKVSVTISNGIQVELIVNFLLINPLNCIVVT